MRPDIKTEEPYRISRDKLNVLARAAASLDRLSHGRFELGLGAGWFDDEHTAYGIPFPTLKERFDRLEEQLEILRGLADAGAVLVDQPRPHQRADQMPRHPAARRRLSAFAAVRDFGCRRCGG